MKTIIRLQISELLNNRFGLLNEVKKEQVEILEAILSKIELVKELKKITGLEFARNIIDVYLIANDGKPSISHPAIVKVSVDDKKTIRVIIHEVIHSLLWDNTIKNNWAKKIQDLYPTETKKAAIHIAVHAVLMAVYYEVIGEPNEIQKDILECEKYEDYKRAWQIVNSEGYQAIIDKLK